MKKVLLRNGIFRYPDEWILLNEHCAKEKECVWAISIFHSKTREKVLGIPYFVYFADTYFQYKSSKDIEDLIGLCALSYPDFWLRIHEATEIDQPYAIVWKDIPLNIGIFSITDEPKKEAPYGAFIERRMIS